MIFTDPPYNVNYGSSSGNGYSKGKYKSKKIFNDDKSDEDFEEFLYKVFCNLRDFSTDAASYYIWHADKTVIQFRNALKRAGWYFSQRITWAKDRFVLSMGQHFHRSFEPCMHGWKQGKKCYFNKKINNISDVWNLKKDEVLDELDLWYVHRDKQKEYIHPTQKPIRLAERALRKSSLRNGVVLESFNGSGSTMMACEQMGRKCYAIELDPKFVDVAVKRYEQFTGKKALKVNKNGVPE